jgi:two-component system, LytTR family, sensor kinase
MNMKIIEKRFGGWLIWLGLWLLIVLFYSTRISAPDLDRTWIDSLKYAAGHWVPWLLLAPIIIHLDRRLPIFRKSFSQRLFCHIPLCLLVSTLISYVSGLLSLARRGEIIGFLLSFDILRRTWAGGFHHVLMYWVILGIYMLQEYNNLLKERAIETADLERSLFEARLNTLKSQIHPHFLFNALNTISAYVENNPRAARRLLEQLGELLRFSVHYIDEQEITLMEELAFINHYLALQKARFEDRLEVNIDVAPETLNARVPTFVLEPFVENAIHHGTALRSQKGVVEIHTKKENDWLHLIVRDNGPGLSPDWNLEHDAGTGINNTLKRLRVLYEDRKFFFRIMNAEGGGVLVEVMLPFH